VGRTTGGEDAPRRRIAERTGLGLVQSVQQHLRLHEIEHRGCRIAGIAALDGFYSSLFVGQVTCKKIDANIST
jgi:hypothetical protein